MLQCLPVDVIYSIANELPSSRDARSLSRTSKQLQLTLESFFDHQSRTDWESLKLPWPLLHAAVHIRNKRLALCALKIDPACVNTVIPYDPATPKQPIGTALHLAVSNLDHFWVGFLLNKGANVHIRDHDGKMALLVALSCTSRSGSDDERVQDTIVDMLLDHHSTRATLAEGLRAAPAMAAPATAQMGSADVTSPITDSDASLNDRLTLRDAVRVPGSMAGLSVIRKLLLNGCQIDKRNSDNRTALFFAHDPRMARFLIGNGASACVVDSTGGTVLHYITRSSNKNKHNIISLLLGNTSVRIKAKDNAGMKAYDYAFAGSDQATKDVFTEHIRNR